MSTLPQCSECDEILWELAEREAGMCTACQKELEDEEECSAQK
jgi:hypothetical protein